MIVSPLVDEAFPQVTLPVNGGFRGKPPGVSPASVTGLVKEMAGSSEFALRQRLGRIQPLLNCAARYSPREGKVNSEWEDDEWG
jgi:hypothetical protein